MHTGDRLPSTVVLALALTALGGAFAASRAEIGPPVTIRLLGGPQYAKLGASFGADIQIVADAGVTLSGFRLEGEGWERAAVEAPASTDLAKSAELQVHITATPQNPDRPLVFAFEADGRTVTRSFDLSEARYRLMTEGGKARAVPTGGQRAPLVPAGIFKGNGPELMTTAVPSAVQGDKSYNVTVTGGWYYNNPIAGWTGSDALTVEVMLDSYLPIILGSALTDVNGQFSITFNWSGGGYPDIYVRFRASNGRLAVNDLTTNRTFWWRTGTWYDFSGTSLDVGGLTSADESLMPVMNILTWFTRAWRWYNDAGFDTASETVFWVPGTGNFHDGAGVHIGDPWHEGGYCHEYTHQWQSVFAVPPDFNYCNGICDGERCSHCVWCEESAEVVIVEGLPDAMGNIVALDIEDIYGLPCNGVEESEIFHMCGSTWADPAITEGFYAGLLNDLFDDEQDLHAGFSLFPDALALGADEFLDVIHTYNPATPIAFLLGLRARYPAINKENLWSTAINCGFNIDTAAPSVVTNLRSTSHTVNVASPDGTIALAWTRAADDAAGVDGYGVFVTHSPGMPSAVLDIGNVTSWTTSALAPGTWYFCIRSRDRAGNWGSTYASCGPYIVREAEIADLQWYAPAGWARCLVPRATNDATFSSVPLPTSLTGNVAATYFNFCGRNAGESATSGQVTTGLYMDGVAKLFNYRASVGAGVTYYTVNSGPYNITGGRHTFETFHDTYEEIQESNETNNRWAHQWVWSPYAMTVATQVTRNKPQAWTAGWDAVTDGSTLYYNCDGLSFQTTRYVDLSYTWDAVYACGTDTGEDYDCRLHAHSTGADNGFATNLGSSMRAAGYLDAVLINGNQVGAATWDVGVVNGHGGAGTYRAEWVRASSIGLDDSVAVAVDANKMMVLRRFDIAVADTGFYSCTIAIDPPSAVWSVNHYLPSFSTGSISQYSDRATTVAGLGVATVDMHITQTGRHALAIYRDPRDSAVAVTVTIELHKTPPDFAPYTASGWHAPFVPRPAADGTPTLVAEPDTLHGNATSTYLNYCWTNDSPNSWPSGGAQIIATVLLDDEEELDAVGWSTVGPHWVVRYNQPTAKAVRGGMHTLAMWLDAGALIGERSESNNLSGAQYCWSPYALTAAVPVNRAVPPDRMGGWSHITSGETKVYNCDGLRMPAVAGETWRAAGVMSGPATDVDLRLHPVLNGAKDGFRTVLTYSSWGSAESDIVLVNGHPAIVAGPATGPYDLGVTLANGLRGYGAEAVSATALATTGADTYGPYTLASNHILQLYELWLTPGDWAIRLDNLSGNVNWGLSIYSPDSVYLNKSSTMDGGISYMNGAGQDEWFTVTVPTPGWYALAAWKAGATDLGQAGIYRLRVYAGVTAVPGDTPRPIATSLVGIQPNPFNPQTSIVYDLAAMGTVRIEIYDLRGTRVRTLVAEEQPAGRHSVIWDGRDDQGHMIASGTYMARLAAGGTAQMRKLALLK